MRQLPANNPWNKLPGEMIQQGQGVVEEKGDVFLGCWHAPYALRLRLERDSCDTIPCARGNIRKMKINTSSHVTYLAVRLQGRRT